MLARSAFSISVNASSGDEASVTAALVRDAATAVSNDDAAHSVGNQATHRAEGASPRHVGTSDAQGDPNTGGVIALGRALPTWTSGGISCRVALRIHAVRNANLVWTTPASEAVAVLA
jgi:hypothetical protein